MNKILVAIDGSISCNKAAKKAEEIALLCETSVTFITVVPLKFKLITSKKELVEENRKTEKRKQEANEFLDECRKTYKKCEVRMGKKGLDINMVVKEGSSPAEQICAFAEDNEFDLIVIADKGKSDVKKFLLGSTTENVVRHAKISVLVVK